MCRHDGYPAYVVNATTSKHVSLGIEFAQWNNMELVAPSGDILTLNEHQNTDLFWAVRGGGGSTYGVITSITFETHPSPAISHLTWAFVVEPGAPFLSDLFAYLLSQLPSLEAAGVSMYCTSQKAASTNPFPIAGLPSEVAGVMGIAVLQDNTDPEALATLWEPMSKAVSERWPSVTFASQSLEFASWVDWFGVTRDTRPVGGNNVMASRLLDETALSEDLDGLSGAIETAMSEAGRLTAFLVSGKAVHEADGNKGGNAVHPSWRRAYVHAITSSSFPSFNATAKSAAIERVDAAVEGLRRLAPDMGSYLNEGSRYEKDWQEAFWGANYPRLLEIKRAVDPNNVFCRSAYQVDRGSVVCKREVEGSSLAT
ncbi:putative FAD-linked oxidoreductase [Colletotrichum orbiculare MAFF 240422]|uniref:FAD-linked oxidoreductase n=1 Tax=Colletotrichum orbiculare (strain 104-T / ATCC 96160 / CBS 514.97 / LARS 414 / MAFF 240422) TaxID=1213857 RepID=A0A484FT38_COLOR|nr:putative FAD-linked oxidoreductase [Colletotrichum orbiculare MAFF 240422]